MHKLRENYNEGFKLACFNYWLKVHFSQWMWIDSFIFSLNYIYLVMERSRILKQLWQREVRSFQNLVSV